MEKKMSKFEIFTGSDDQFYFHLKADNGEIIAASQGYTTKESAEGGIDAIKRIAISASVVDLTHEQSESLPLSVQAGTAS